MKADLTKALKLTTGWRPQWSDAGNIYKPSAAQVEQVLSKMEGNEVAYDIETDGGHPLNCQIRCLGFFDGERAICIPFLYRDGSVKKVEVDGKMVTRKIWKPFYAGASLERVKQAIQKLFNSSDRGSLNSFKGTKLDTQNGQYDRLCLESTMGFHILDASGDNFDTILAHHIVAGFLPHSLGFLASLYTEAPYYKATESGESWASESDLELWLYNLRDCRVTRIAAHKLRQEIKERKEDIALYQHDAWQEAQAQEWRYTGVEVDLEALDYFRWHYSTARDTALEKLKTVAAARVTKAIAQGTQGKKHSALEALLKRLTEVDAEEMDDAGKTVERFNPGSLIQLRMMLVELGIPLTEKTATGEISTAKEFLTNARKELLEAKVAPTDDRLAFLDYLFAWREASKVYGTYLSPEVVLASYPTSRGTEAVRVHPSFSVHVVPTGRISSKAPNFQNQPALIRGMYVARHKHVLVMADWDALEMRLGAFLSQDPTFIEDLAKWDNRTGPKVHIVNMCAIFGLTLEKGIEKKYPGCYRAAKVFAYAVAYGAGSQTVFEQVRAEMPDMQWNTFLECYNRYKKFRKVLFQFQAQVVLKGTQHQYLDSSILGRRMWFWERSFGEDSPEASRMQNAPYQSSGADIVSLANRRVYEQVVLPFRNKLRPNEVLQQLAQIHDELLFEVPERLAPEFEKEFKRVAELPCDKEHASWSLPVDAKTQRRWKLIERRCGAVLTTLGKDLKPQTCKTMVAIEPVKRTEEFITWAGVCETCKKKMEIHPPRSATLSEVVWK